MKVYINKYLIKEPVVAYIDNIVVKTETFLNGYVYEEKAVNVKQIKDIIYGLNKLGYEVNKITIESNFVYDMDNKYYKSFPEDVIDKLWESMHYKWGKEVEVFIKGNRLYTNVDGYTIVLPKRIFTDYDSETLRVYFYTKKGE